MSINRILINLRKNEDEFITSNTIRDYSNKLHYQFDYVIKFLTSQGFILEILNDLFYVKDIDEINNHKLKYSNYELISKMLAFKKITSWYFGLNTALTFDLSEKNEIFFEHDTSIDYIINYGFSVDRPIKINGNQFSFLTFKEDLLNFGIIDNGKFRYSNLEKTILDYIYLYQCNNVREGKIIVEISKYKKYVSMKRILEYMKHYPKNVEEILEKTFFKNNLI
ncbi:MAG: hypothetical protein ACTSR8_08825 [Promethearchaeota archaeon]